MVIPPIDIENAQHYFARLENLKDDSQSKFGTFTPAGMCKHMRTSFEAAQGKTKVKDISIPIVRDISFFLSTRIIKVWPGGKVKAPGYWAPPAEHDFKEEVRLLIESIHEFHTNKTNVGFPHPLFGKLTHRQWELLLGPHLNHHLRQFNC